MAAEEGLTPGDFQRALEIQDIDSLPVVALSFSAVLPRILGEAANNSMGLEWINAHPISVLYTNKMVSLTGECVSGGVLFSDAYDACALSAKGKGGKKL